MFYIFIIDKSKRGHICDIVTLDMQENEGQLWLL